MYEVLVTFMDLNDDKHIYKKGDTFPRKGYEPTKDIIARYTSDKNPIEKALIKAKK